MKPFRVVSAALAVSLADAYLVSPPGTPAPGATEYCSAWIQQSYGLTCAIIERIYGMNEAQFESWNPSVTQLGPGCNLLQDLYYCVQVNYVSISVSKPTPTPTRSTTITTTTTISAENGISTPTPTQSGMTNDCTTFYKVHPEDTCQIIIDRYGTFTLANFYEWNPAIGLDCHSLWVDYYVCVGISGTLATNLPSASLSFI